MVFIIALIPAILVFAVAEFTNSKVWTSVAAGIALVVGIGTGNPLYTILDVACVVVVYWLSMSSLSGKSPKKSTPFKWATEEEQAETARNGLWIGIASVLALAFAGYMRWI